MAKKGRPFTYQSDEERPVTISLRLAHDLYDRLEWYAQRHRQSVSELVRDGIEMRLAVQADPRWQTAQEQESYYDNTVLQKLATPAHMLDDRIPFDDDHMPVPAPATVAVADMPYDNNTVIQESVPKRRVRKMPATVLQDAQTPALAEDAPGHSADVPAYDTTRFYLGKLCPKGHEFDWHRHEPAQEAQPELPRLRERTQESTTSGQAPGPRSALSVALPREN